MSELESGFKLSEVADLLKRRFPIVLGAAVLGLVIGIYLFSSTPSRYGATARVSVAPLTTSGIGAEPTGGSDSEKVDMPTEQDLVKSDAVAEAARDELGITTDNRTFLQNVTVTSKEESRVLEITFDSATASGARDGANAVGEAYLAQRRGKATASRDKSLGILNEQIAEVRTSLAEAEAAADTTSIAEYQATLNDLNASKRTLQTIDTDDVGQWVRKAVTPTAVLSKMALAKGVGVFGIFVLGGVGAALLVDRRDSMGGGRRRVEQLLPGVNIRLMPTVTNRKAGPAEVDAAIDRLAVELAGGGARGRATSVLVAGTRMEPPVALAEELASSLTFAGIPALFVLAGSSERELRQAQVITSFADLITGPSVTGPAGLPEVAGAGGTASTPLVTWLRPRGSAEASGLLRRAVVEALVTRAGREGFEAVVFVAPTPTRNAAAAALGQWVTKTAVIVEGDDSQAVEQTVSALKEADVRVTEVVWT